jgi:large subunit ribosomal protein L18
VLNTAGIRERARKRRQARVRKKIRGVSDRPRLSVFKSAKHIYAQLIDDGTGQTLAAVSSLSPTFRERVGGMEQTSGGNINGAKLVGELLARAAIAKGIARVVFDRNGFLYHGRVKEVADAARAAGLQF